MRTDTKFGSPGIQISPGVKHRTYKLLETFVRWWLDQLFGSSIQLHLRRRFLAGVLQQIPD
jgi:hypothetical protein